MGFIWFSTCSLPCWTDGRVCMISKQLQHISPQMMQQINKHFKMSFPDESIQHMTMTTTKTIQLKSTSTSLSQNSKFCRQNFLWYQGNSKPWALNLNKKAKQTTSRSKWAGTQAGTTHHPINPSTPDKEKDYFRLPKAPANPPKRPVGGTRLLCIAVCMPFTKEPWGGSRGETRMMPAGFRAGPTK